jgi:hypothetical protein
MKYKFIIIIFICTLLIAPTVISNESLLIKHITIKIPKSVTLPSPSIDVSNTGTEKISGINVTADISPIIEIFFLGAKNHLFYIPSLQPGAMHVINCPIMLGLGLYNLSVTAYYDGITSTAGCDYILIGVIWIPVPF